MQKQAFVLASLLDATFFAAFARVNSIGSRSSRRAQQPGVDVCDGKSATRHNSVGVLAVLIFVLVIVGQATKAFSFLSFPISYPYTYPYIV